MDPADRVKRQPTEWEEHISDNIQNILRNSYNSTRKTQLENGQRTWKDISPKKIYKWPIYTGRCSKTSLIIRELQIKTTRRWHFTPIMMMIIKQKKSVGEDVGKFKPLRIAGRIPKRCSHCGKQYGRYSKIKHGIFIWYSTSTSGCVYPQKKSRFSDTCTPMFIVALFTTAKRCKQPKCSWIGKQINKVWYIYIQWNIIRP